mgnify:CR=1 FL=1
MNNIFKDLEELIKIIEKEKNRGKEIVLANGCFDIIHVGHVRYLAGAKSYGDILVVAINDDKSTRKLKGPPRPIMPEEERAEIIASIRFVDYVLIFSDETVDSILLALKPHVHAKGTDYSVESVPEYDTARSIGCKTIIVGDPKEHSSSEIIDRYFKRE